LQGHASGKLTQLLVRLKLTHEKPLKENLLSQLEDTKAAQVVTIYEQPEGRRGTVLKK
jgi:hypothetical protein